MTDPRDEIDREIQRIEDQMMSSDDSRYDDLHKELDRLEDARLDAEYRAHLQAEYRDTEEYPPENLPD